MIFGAVMIHVRPCLTAQKRCHFGNAILLHYSAYEDLHARLKATACDTVRQDVQTTSTTTAMLAAVGQRSQWQQQQRSGTCARLARLLAKRKSASGTLALKTC
ncbi:unnamed protein product [Toxocara canis]|uniref:Secreted protein n=1 Tax=Toxocara canis TaxID=6265 RepID=A0A183UDP4_TOXCA|nr:unnamed protein product [Toxocara canis]